MKIFRYDGTFELAFLRSNEFVRSAGPKTDAIEIVDKNGNVKVRIKLGETVIRDANGLRVLEAK